MSHLPLDARAILEYLNELGYRNISAQQLKEFLKGMQPQPEINSYNNSSNSNNKNNSSRTNNKTKIATTTTNNNIREQHRQSEATAAINTATIAQDQQQQQQHENNKVTPTIKLRPRVIKSKQPLLNFHFYLDIRDHQLTKRIEKQIKLLGGKQQFFLDANVVTHFITDKTELPINLLNVAPISRIEQPKTPVTPQNNLLHENAIKQNTNRVAQTRADAILSRVRLQSGLANSSPIRAVTPTLKTTTTYISNNRSNCNLEPEKSALPTTTPYTVWQTDYALRFFKKVQHELKSYLQPENLRGVGAKTNQQREKLLKAGIRTRTQSTIAAAANCGINVNSDTIQFKGGFIKIESIKRSCRPYYQLFRRPHSEWPKISLTSDDGAFCFLTNNKPTTTITKHLTTTAGAMTRKSRSRSSQCVTPLPLPVATVQNLRKQSNVATTPTASTPTTCHNNSQCPQIKDSTDKQCGVCEICKIEYDTLTIHLKTKDHEYFAKNSQNFLALDTLIKSSADVNKFLADEVENNKAIVKGVTNDLDDMVVDEDVLTHDIVDPLEQSLDVALANHSPPLRERSKRSTKGKHSSEKFQQTRAKALTVKTTATTPPTPPTITTLDLTPNKHNNSNSTRRKTNAVKNLSSPVRPFPPPSSLYKVVETSQLEQTPKRGAAGRVNDNVNGSPSLIVKFKKVRQTELLRLNGEAENFMFPNKQQQQRRASSDLPTDIDRHSSSDRLRTSICSSSSLDSSVVSDIIATTTEAKIAVALTNEETPLKRGPSIDQLSRKRNGTFAKRKSFQKAPIQPESLQQLNTASPTTTTRKSTTKTNNRKTKQTVSLVADLSPPSAAAAIVAATAKITLPAATRKSSRTATAIVSAATTSSRLLMAAAEVVKKSGKTKRTNASQNINTTTSKIETETETVGITVKCEVDETETELSNAATTTTTSRSNNRMRSCRLVDKAAAKVVKMEDRMGDSSATNSENEDNIEKKQNIMDIDDSNIDHVGVKEEGQEEQIIDIKVSRRRRRRLSRAGQNDELYSLCAKTTTAATPIKSNRNISVNKIIEDVIDDDDDDEEEEDDDDDAEDNDDVIADKDFKYKLTKLIRRPTGKRRRGKRKRRVRSLPKRRKTMTSAAATTITGTNENVKLESSDANEKSPKDSKNDMQSKIKLAQFYDYQKSERIQQQTYAFERVPQTDLWYRVFMRQDDCEEQYFEYFGSTEYHKLPYELGPIPYYHTNIGENSCNLCQSGKRGEHNEKLKDDTRTDLDIKEELHETEAAMNNKIGIEETAATTPATTTMESHSIAKTTTTTTTPYTLKHKKLHLLQRYRQEQEALEKQAEQNQENKEQERQHKENQQHIKLEELITMETDNLTNGIQSDIERCERAGSTQSTTSSCASSNNTNGPHNNSRHRKRSAFRNKLLNKAAILSLELPPRKSPREHASTLALVSIIKQRQESKSNSDADDIASTPTTPIPLATSTLTPIPSNLPLAINTGAVKEEAVTIKTILRSTAATPVEEMCFATEISENVKRMRRGRNKYDHSPPYVLSSSRRLARKKLIKNEEPKEIDIVEKEKQKEKVRTPTVQLQEEEAKPEQPKLPKSPIHRLKKIFQPSKAITRKTSSLARTKTPILINNNYNTMLHSKGINLPPSVRKTGQKKGVLEFSVEESALNALNEALKPKVSAQQLVSQIDQFLTDNCKEFEFDELPAFESPSIQQDKVETPPATDYFSSDFDLCDLLQDSGSPLLGDEEVQERSREKKHLNLYNTMSVNKYFHKRKYMKSNRTGWPKVPRKKYSMRHQTIIQSQMVKTAPEVKLVTPPDSEENKVEIQSIIANLADEVDKEPEREDTVIENLENLKCDETDVDTFYDGAETLPEEDDAETLPDSVVEEEMEGEVLVRSATPVVCKEVDEEDEKAVEADDEDEFNDALETEEIEDCAKEDEEGMVEDANISCKSVEHDQEEEDDEINLPKNRRSNLGNALVNCLSSLNESSNIEEHCVVEDTNSMTATTSTPTTHMTRNLRRTPQLNGSLVSCNSPSERAGDNSDIFTVSSDGLDTDLDLSNPHPHTKHDEQQQQTVATCHSRSKSNKYDITKYVKNPAANTCAAEAATAAAKSLAIAQFLKKEVRVTCRRIRAPFRRFRYRR